MMTKREWRRETTAQGYVTASPLPTDLELQRHYEEKYYQDSTSATYRASYSDAELQQIRLRANMQVGLAMRVLKEIRGDAYEKPSFLDVGCGEGFNLAAADAQGMKVEGIDFSRHAIQNFHPHLMTYFRSGNAYQLLDELIGAGRKYDIVLLKNVLEHVLDPTELMRRLIDVLDGGVMVVQVPNDESTLQHWLLDNKKVERPYWFLPPEHLHYFNHDTFKNFVEMAGLRIVDMIADFPIEWFLMHDGANYAAHPNAGPQAHQARVQIELLMAEAGMERLEEFYRALAGCRQGRSFVAYLAKA